MVLGIRIKVTTEAGVQTFAPEDWAPAKQEAKGVNVHRDLVWWDGAYRDMREMYFNGDYVVFGDGVYRVDPDTKIRTLVRACWLQKDKHWIDYEKNRIVWEDGLEANSFRGGDDYTCPGHLLKVTDHFFLPEYRKVFYPYQMHWDARDPIWRTFDGSIERDVPQAEWDRYHKHRGGAWGREYPPPQELLDISVRVHVDDWFNLRDVKPERVVAGMKNANGLIVRVERAGEYKITKTETINPPPTIYKIITNGSWGRKEGFIAASDRVILQSGNTVPLSQLTIGMVDFYDQEIVGVEKLQCTRS